MTIQQPADVADGATKPVSHKRPHRVGETCPACGHQTLIAPCSLPDCMSETTFCWGCPDVLERFTASEGRCEGCRGKAAPRTEHTAGAVSHVPSETQTTASLADAQGCARCEPTIGR